MFTHFYNYLPTFTHIYNLFTIHLPTFTINLSTFNTYFLGKHASIQGMCDELKLLWEHGIFIKCASEFIQGR